MSLIKIAKNNPILADVEGFGTMAITEITTIPDFYTNQLEMITKGYLVRTKTHSFNAILVDPYESVQKIIVNGPATIIFWADGTKTIVKYRKVGKSKNNRYVAIVWAIAKKLAGSRNRLEKYIRKNSEAIDKKSANENDIVAMLLMGWLGKTPYELKKLIEDLVDKKLEIHE